MSSPFATLDVELASKPQEYLDGFADFSEFIASDPDLSIFRRFESLSARNMLYLQGELVYLEAKLKSFDDEDKRIINTGGALESSEVLRAARDWESFARKAHEPGRHAERMKIVLEIRRVVKEYQEALLRQKEVHNLKAPRPHILAGFANWFSMKRPFLGDGKHLLDDKRDMVTLRPDIDEDRLSLLLEKSRFGLLFRENRKVPSSWGDIYYFPSAIVARAVSFISILLVAALLVGAIVALNFVHKPNSRLGILAVFTTGFSATVWLLTNARRAELFASTAAYAAVLVVFVSSGNLSGNPLGNAPAGPPG